MFFFTGFNEVNAPSQTASFANIVKKYILVGYNKFHYINCYAYVIYVIFKLSSVTSYRPTVYQPYITHHILLAIKISISIDP